MKYFQRSNRLLLEFKQTTVNANPIKQTFFRWLFRMPMMYKGFSIHRCTSIDHAMDFIRNKGLKNVITAYWYDKQGNIVRLISDGKVSLMYKLRAGNR